MPDPVLHDTLPCPEDFSSYLEVTYSCVKGMDPDHSGPGTKPTSVLQGSEETKNSLWEVGDRDIILTDIYVCFTVDMNERCSVSLAQCHRANKLTLYWPLCGEETCLWLCGNKKHHSDSFGSCRVVLAVLFTSLLTRTPGTASCCLQRRSV